MGWEGKGGERGGEVTGGEVRGGELREEQRNCEEVSRVEGKRWWHRSDERGG